MESHPHRVTEDQELSSPHNSDSVVPASVSSESHLGQEQMRCEIPMECSELEAIMEGCLPLVVSCALILMS